MEVAQGSLVSRDVRLQGLLLRCKPFSRRWCCIRNAIIEERLPVLRAYARRFSDERYTFDELLSEACFLAMERIAKFDPLRHGGGSLCAHMLFTVRKRLLGIVTKRSRLCSFAHNDEGAVINEPVARRDSSLDVEAREEVQLVVGAMSQLTAAEKSLLHMRYVDGMESTTVANVFGVHHSYARILEQNAIRKMQHHINPPPPTPADAITEYAKRVRAMRGLPPVTLGEGEPSAETINAMRCEPAALVEQRQERITRFACWLDGKRSGEPLAVS